MAANMMIAPVASSAKVNGIRIAVPAAGPSPGSTPMSVPRMQPASANRRFAGVSAAAKPDHRNASPSIARSEAEDADRQRHLEQAGEHVEHAEASREGEDRDRHPVPRPEDQEDVRDREQHRDAKTGELEQRGRGD